MGVPHKSIWRDPALEQFLRQCILDGDSSQTCADKMRLSRSAVIGKARRIKLSFKGVNDAAINKRITGQKKARESLLKTLAEKLRKPKAPLVRRDPYAGQGANMRLQAKKSEPVHSKPNNVQSPNRKPLELTTASDCKWVCDDGLMCCNVALVGKSWCSLHDRIVYWRPTDRRMTTANELARSLRKFI